MKFVCPVCGYVEEFDGDQLPEDFKCPQCGVPGSRFLKQDEGGFTWAAEHVVGVAKEGVPEDIVAGLRANFEGECSEVGMYLAMARVAHREGYPEIGLYWEKAAYEEAEHAAKFAELLGEVVTDSTKKNLEMRVDAENGATAGKIRSGQAGQGCQPRRHPRHRARDGSRRGPPRQGLRGPAEALLRLNQTKNNAASVDGVGFEHRNPPHFSKLFEIGTLKQKSKVDRILNPLLSWSFVIKNHGLLSKFNLGYLFRIVLL